MKKNMFSAEVKDTPFRYMVTACTSFQNGFAPPEADINGVVKTCFENIRANTDPDEYNKMINLPIKQWGNKSVEELLECIPAAPEPCVRQGTLKRASGAQIFGAGLGSACSHQIKCTAEEEQSFTKAIQEAKWKFGSNDVPVLRRVQKDLKARFGNNNKAAKVVLPVWGGTLGQFLKCRF
ncbi:unnamed protein product [Enterobius vermicularis]|uniref:PriCT_2 domain-containing protein n=1 Tax=Enterobius vermicularis TaxID=51028 RepID=A0A0N4UTX7_ENTVE|nr:unnamed protein product [Enterobius vermicularis]